MHAIVVDDERIARACLCETLSQIQEITEVTAFSSSDAALEWLSVNEAQVSFLDIQMHGMDGLTLARLVREKQPGCAIIFVTGYPQYALEAIQARATGYLMKPVSVADIRREIDHIKTMTALSQGSCKGIRIQCFGNFEVFADGEPMKFKHSKSKELLAYLVDRKGASCEMSWLCGVLWEERPYSISLKSQLRHVIADLIATFAEAGCPDAIDKRRNAISIRPDKVNCDYFSWLAGSSNAMNGYAGEYMQQYSWAETTVALLEKGP